MERRRVLRSSKTEETKAEKKFTKELLNAVTKALRRGDEDDEPKSDLADDSESDDDDSDEPYVQMFIFINRYELLNSISTQT